MKWFVHALKNTFNFSGRARRQEYWMYYLFGIIISFVIVMIEEMLNLKFSPEVGILSTLFGIIFMIPSLSVTVRRLMI
ncbi:Inner membrane protein yhaH [Lysinibacillus sphaericus]|uniref:Inner membrane protein yhaH n=1 Tax=Lysinibacillus sphaericus TaxID=1421 RepID=A0AAJ5DF92_LYSSH|nr:Inner membrane protein yhaH [Lysinibacillus sphaericus]